MADTQVLLLPRRTGLPYAFAREYGVILESGADGPVCVHRPSCALSALIEVQRIAGPGLRLEQTSAEMFDTRLAAAYRDNASDASDAAGALECAVWGGLVPPPGRNTNGAGGAGPARPVARAVAGRAFAPDGQATGSGAGEMVRSRIWRSGTYSPSMRQTF